MRAIVKFTKTGAARYTSHLDLLRSMQRNIRRANLPVIYSQGFNPHQRVAFASASSVGVGSLGEWMDIKLEDGGDCGQILTGLNDCNVEGITFLEIHEVAESYPALMKIVVVADYWIDIFPESGLSQEQIEHLIKLANSSEIFAEKKSKRGLETVDISKFIIKIESLEQDITKQTEQEDNKCFRLFCRLKHESTGALNPNLLVPSLLKLWDLPARYSATRINLFAQKDGEYVPVWSL